MKKNILKSILITNFIVIIFVIAFEYVTRSIALNYADSNHEEMRYTLIDYGRGMEESLQLQGLSNEDRYLEEGKFINDLLTVSTLSTLRLLAYAIIFSITIGAGIGYVVTVVDGSKVTSSIIKKVIVTYFIGMLLVPSVIALLGYLEHGAIDPPEMIVSIIIWTVVFVITLLVKKAVDTKKAKNLKDIFELTKTNQNKS